MKEFYDWANSRGWTHRSDAEMETEKAAFPEERIYLSELAFSPYGLS